jgi:hypothetical protein
METKREDETFGLPFLLHQSAQLGQHTVVTRTLNPRKFLGTHFS